MHLRVRGLAVDSAAFFRAWCLFLVRDVFLQRSPRTSTRPTRCRPGETSYGHFSLLIAAPARRRAHGGARGAAAPGPHPAPAARDRGDAAGRCRGVRGGRAVVPAAAVESSRRAVGGASAHVAVRWVTKVVRNTVTRWPSTSRRTTAVPNTFSCADLTVGGKQVQVPLLCVVPHAGHGDDDPGLSPRRDRPGHVYAEHAAPCACRSALGCRLPHHSRWCPVQRPARQNG